MGTRETALKNIFSEEGFTLFEAIISLAVVSIIIVLASSAVRLGLSSWERGERTAVEASSRRFIAEVFARDVASMALYAQRGEKGMEVLFDAGPSSFGFVTVSSVHGDGRPWGGARFVRYSADEGGLRLGSLAVPMVDLEEYAVRSHKEVETEVDGAVTGLSFEYLGAAGWQRNFIVSDKRELPFAVRATFEFKDTGPLVLTVPVRALEAPPEEGPKGGQAW